MMSSRRVAEGRINLDWTLAGICIDNLGGLPPLEKRVRVSGVCYGARADGPCAAMVVLRDGRRIARQSRGRARDH